MQGVYDVLARFHAATGRYMGSEGTHPWVQGSPLEGPVPGGPAIPTSVDFLHSDLKYPSGVGEPILIARIVEYYKHFYNANIDADNVFIFAGGKACIVGTLSFIDPSTHILVDEVEYSQYYDALVRLNKKYAAVRCGEENGYRTGLQDYAAAERACGGDSFFVMKSNPANPTGVVWEGDQLRELVEHCSQPRHGGLFDEAYEFFHTSPDSALRYIKDINKTNICVMNAATKGLQVPGVRVAWVVASKEHIALFKNYSSVSMGGVSRLSQIYVARLLDIDRVVLARTAVNAFYAGQRTRYRAALIDLGCTVFGSEATFYLWVKLPNDLSGEEFNVRLFAEQAAILPGSLCDVLRRGDASPHRNFVRFSFGPLFPESFEDDVSILRRCLSPDYVLRSPASPKHFFMSSARLGEVQADALTF
jgi:aminotransferase